jgi:hypothetical protein
MRHPLESIPNPYRKRIFFVLLTLTLVLLIALRVVDEPLHTDVAPNGIVSFELATTPQAARAITDSWKQSGLMLSAVAGQSDPDIVNTPYMLAAFSLGFDYLFMPAYALTLVLGTLLACQRHGGLAKSLGAVAGYAALVAPVFDALENYSLLRVLLGEFQSGYPALAAFCAIIKFGLIASSLLYTVFAGLFPKK